MATKSTGRKRPSGPKAGLTRNRDRRYGCEGKLKKCGGSVKKEYKRKNRHSS